MALLIGLDVGTTAVKCIIVSDKLEVIVSCESEYPLSTPHQGWVEQDPKHWWNVLRTAVRSALSKLHDGARSQIAAIGLSSQGGALAPLDDLGQPIRPAISWLDQRSKPQVERLTKEFGIDFFYRRSGWSLRAGLPLTSLVWLRENEPENFRRAARFVTTADYIAYRLTGRYVIDKSSACISVLYNLLKRDWDEELLAIAGISKSRLSDLTNPMQEIGPLSCEAAGELGLRAGLPVYAGGHDQFCVALGAGVINPGEVLLSTGTAWVLVCAVENLTFDHKNYLALEEHVVPGLWGILSSIPAGGASMRWLKNFIGEQDYKAMDRDAEAISPGSDGLFFFPHLAGAGAPHWEGSHFGTIIGLRLGHARGHVSRALMECVGYEVRWALECFRDLGANPIVLKMLGGGSRSFIWPRIIADITGVEVEIPNVSEAGALGAAILAGLGCGILTSLQCLRDLARHNVRIHPDDLISERYSHLYGTYQKIFRDLSGLYKEIETTI